MPVFSINLAASHFVSISSQVPENQVVLKKIHSSENPGDFDFGIYIKPYAVNLSGVFVTVNNRRPNFSLKGSCFSSKPHPLFVYFCVCTRIDIAKPNKSLIGDTYRSRGWYVMESV